MLTAIRLLLGLGGIALLIMAAFSGLMAGMIGYALCTSYYFTSAWPPNIEVNAYGFNLTAAEGLALLALETLLFGGLGFACLRSAFSRTSKTPE